MRDPNNDPDLYFPLSILNSLAEGVTQLHTTRNFLRAAHARMDGYLDACPQPLGKHRLLMCKDPDAYFRFILHESQSTPSTVQNSPRRATFCAQPNPSNVCSLFDAQVASRRPKMPPKITMPDARLTEDYRRDGVIVVPGLLSNHELTEVRDRIVRYQQQRLPTLPKGDYTLEPDGQTVRNLWRMEQHDSFFLAMASRRRFLELVSPLVNGVPVLVGVETFNKPARVGSAVPPHQDNAYFCQTPPDVLTVWIAIDPATAENGAVEYLRGSHVALRPHVPSGVRGNSFGIAESPPEEFSRFLGEIAPGDALIHHSQTVHFSAPNRSDQSRLSLIFVYRGQHTTTDPQLKEAYTKAATLTPPNV